LDAGNGCDLCTAIAHESTLQELGEFFERAFHGFLYSSTTRGRKGAPLGDTHTIAVMQRRIFWLVFIVLGLTADFLLPLWWAVLATAPIVAIAWWVAYRSDWF
jgi:hypothetical protein